MWQNGADYPNVATGDGTTAIEQPIPEGASTPHASGKAHLAQSPGQTSVRQNGFSLETTNATLPTDGQLDGEIVAGKSLISVKMFDFRQGESTSNTAGRQHLHLYPMMAKGLGQSEVEVHSGMLATNVSDRFVPEGVWDDEGPYLVAHQTSRNMGRSSWALGGVVSPSHSFRTLNGSGAVQTNVNESGLSSINGGLTLKKFFGDKWVFESGVVFTRAGQQLKYPETYTIDSPSGVNSAVTKAAQNDMMVRHNSLGVISKKQNGGNSGREYSNEPFFSTSLDQVNQSADIAFVEEGPIKQLLDYLEIPMSARFYLAKVKWGALSFSGGLSANFLVGNNVLQTVNGKTEDIGSTSSIQNLSLSSHVGVGFDMPLSSNLTITMEPVFKYFITPVNQAGTYDFRPYTFGMNTGLSYRF